MSHHPTARDERFRRPYVEHFDALLGYALRRVDRPEDAAGFAAAVPDDVVTSEESSAEVVGILADVAVPDGFDRSRIEIEGFNSRYHVIAAATGAVTCAWVEQYAAGRRAEATHAMAGSRECDALREIVDEGDWSEIGVWSVADEMAAGPARRARPGAFRLLGGARPAG